MAIKITNPDGSIIIIGVTSIPSRKNKCLYRMTGNTLYPLAYFKKDEDAVLFDEFLKTIIETIENGGGI